MESSTNNTNLDFLRSVAVLCVFVAHLTYFYGLTSLGPLSLMTLGYWGVLIFFVHTCLVLMFSLERQYELKLSHRLWLGFMIRRCFRIFPLSIVVVIAIATLRIPQATFEPGHFAGTNLTPWTIFTNLALVQNLTKTTSICGPMWSLPYELQMYFVLPPIFLLVRPVPSIWRVAGIWAASVAFALLVALHHRRMVPDLALFIPCFLPGVIAYQVQRRRRFQLPAFLWPPALAVLTLFALQGASGSSPVENWGKQWAEGLLLGLAASAFAEMSFEPLVVTSRIIARYSYGIYLTHFFAIWFGLEHLRSSSVVLKSAVFVLVVIGLPVILYHFVEEPMIRVGKELADRLQTSAGVRGASAG